MVGATASPISRPNTASSPTVSWIELRAANRMPIRQPNAAMNATMPTPPVRLRPSQAPRANNAAVTATYPMVCANSTCVWSAGRRPHPLVGE